MRSYSSLMAFFRVATILVMISPVLPPLPAQAAGSLVVYSARKEELLRPVLAAFERDQGIAVTLLSGGAGELARRIEIERSAPQGDIFIGTTAGLAELLRAKELLAPYRSSRTQLIPPEFKAPDDTWVGVTGRVRVIIYNTRRVRPEELPRSFFDLTDPKWKNTLAVASMAERTTISWLAAILTLKGEEFTTRYVRDLKGNGLTVLKDNTEVRKAVARGEYALGITNHYYYLIQLREDPESPVGLIYPDQGPGEMGTPVMSITAAILRGARHRTEAAALIDYLLTPKGNRLLVEGEFEIPLLPQVSLVGKEKGIKGLGEFTRAPLTQVQMAEREPQVEKLFGPFFVP